ncbi:hypothetical protein [Streptomyces sp. NBC_00568]|uniref:hypothetical protein n=1 Tax=Streptomyces sp. NBC_00568 TaxID=2975779 RepID=UPI002254DDB4|nr:hypothetical protein [Streptomyces sp. NBC_00568]MCX4993442.1 hypothetical protein [Streptomyces sp. NBC_00568]
MPSRNSNDLVVPVEVSALAVNTRTQNTGAFVFHRWRTNFHLLADNHMPAEPPPFQIDQWPPEGGTGRGVYVKWTLPEALCNGRQDDEEGVKDFPLVPNRWLVVRYQAASRTVRSWIVESDHLGENGTVSFLDPEADEIDATAIGRRHDLTASSPWREPDDARAPFLTAVGSGVLTFAAYQPYNENVFSLHDTLQDVPGDDRLSYYVAGWYADPDADILTTGEGSLTDLLDDLEWLAPGATSTVNRSLFTGCAIGVDWQPDGDIPDSDIPKIPVITDPNKPPTVAVSIGNSTAEAMAGLPEQADGPDSLSTDEARLMRAFALGTLNDLDRTDGDEFIERTAHQSGFGPVPAGYTWRIVERGDRTTTASLPPEERARQIAREQDVVSKLNQAQADHDADVRDLAAAQERLYLLWALSRAEKKPSAEFEERLADELNPGNDQGAAGRVKNLQGKVTDKRAVIPWGTTPDELEASAAQYAADQGLRSGHVLQRVPQPSYEEAADPVVLIQGARLNAPLSRESLLPCRTPDRLVTAIGTITAASVQQDVDQVNTAGLPETVSALLTEFFILDRALLAGADLDDPDAVDGALPEYGTKPWRQPWEPLFLQWAVDYTALPYLDEQGPHWTFDGTRYNWDGTGEVPDHFVIEGRQTLAPTAGHDLDGKIAVHSAHRADLPDLRGLREEIRELDMLSQRLDGLGAFLAQRDPRSTEYPTGDMGRLVGHADHHAPLPGTVPHFSWEETISSTFFELRTGQLAFRQLTVVDRFGRAVNLFNPDSPGHFKPCRPASMIPDNPVSDSDTHRFVELSPRLLQPARLGFDFLSADSDDDVDLTPGTNPVCAWLINNRLDRTLACYDPTGRPWGELRTIMRGDGNRAVVWAPLPGSPVLTLEDLQAASPHTHDLLAPIVAGGPDTLEAVRQAIDDALATIDPEGPDDTGLGFLLGRPLALVRARLDLQLYGPARTSVGWNEVLDPDQHAPAMPDWDWIVRLGLANATDDGLVGYVLNEDYDHFETLTQPTDTADGYLRWIAEDRLKLAFTGTSTATVTLLLDPRAAVHAVTDILPTGAVHVPQQFVDDALARMAICFRTGPLLAPATTDPATAEPLTAVMPHPATATGTWSWTELTEPADPAGPSAWHTLPVTVPDPHALPLGDPEIRAGFLILGGAADATR